jgi:single-strand DNA-binding protein
MAKGTTNKVIIIGNLGQDPEVRYTQSGSAVANISVATNEGYFDKEENWVDKTEWHKCVIWVERLVERAKGLRSGEKVFVEGKLQTRKWTDQNNQTRYTTEIVARDLYGINPPKAEDLKPTDETPSEPKAEELPVPEEEEDDSVPF